MSELEELKKSFIKKLRAWLRQREKQHKQRCGVRNELIPVMTTKEVVVWGA